MIDYLLFPVVPILLFFLRENTFFTLYSSLSQIDIVLGYMPSKFWNFDEKIPIKHGETFISRRNKERDM